MNSVLGMVHWPIGMEGPEAGKGLGMRVQYFIISLPCFEWLQQLCADCALNFLLACYLPVTRASATHGSSSCNPCLCSRLTLAACLPVGSG